MKHVTMRMLLPISKRSIKGIMTIKEIKVKSVLTKTGIPGVDYCINPYVGCSHSCRYCYATFMTRYSGHTEAWGEFVDIKVNAPEVLEKEIKRKKKGRVIISSVTDAYQPVEGKYQSYAAVPRSPFTISVSCRYPHKISPCAKRYGPD